MARFPFSAIVGQDEMKTALLIAAVEPRIGGVMVFGDRGTGKSTAARSLAALMPPIAVVADCRYGCAPGSAHACPDPCSSKKTARQPVPFVDLPLGATMRH
jgi:magnesium chelatase subunit I